MASVLVENKRSHLAPQDKINLIVENNSKSIKLSRRNSELLKTVADLLVQRKMVESHSSLQIKQDKGSSGLLIADVARNFVFEVWSNEDKREGVREKMMHRLLREFPIPNLLVADFDFEFNGRDYLIRQRCGDEISLEAYLKAEEKPIDLDLADVIRGIKTLYEIQLFSKPGWDQLCQTRPVDIFTDYSANHTIIVPNKEGGYDFKYELSSDVSLCALYSRDNTAKIHYVTADFDYSCQFSVYKSMAEAAKVAGASPELVARIKRKGMHDRVVPLPVDDILGTDHPYIPLAPIEHKRTPIPASNPNNEHLLSHIADLLLQHNLLPARPELKISHQTKLGYLLLDSNKNTFEIAWLCGTEDANRRDIAIHRILREEKVPHLITAEFGFQFESYTGLLFRRHCDSLSLYDASRSNKAVMSLRDVLRAVREMSDLFLQYIVPLNHISTARPLSFTARSFGSQNTFITPNGKGGYDWAFEVGYSFRVMKLADDGVGILLYENDPYNHSYCPIFGTLGTVAEKLGYEELEELISDLDFNDSSFADQVNHIFKLHPTSF